MPNLTRKPENCAPGSAARWIIQRFPRCNSRCSIQPDHRSNAYQTDWQVGWQAGWQRYGFRMHQYLWCGLESQLFSHAKKGSLTLRPYQCQKAEWQQSFVSINDGSGRRGEARRSARERLLYYWNQSHRLLTLTDSLWHIAACREHLLYAVNIGSDCTRLCEKTDRKCWL